MRYHERLWPSPWLFLATGLVIPAALIVFLPIDLRIGIGVAIVLYGAIVATFIGTTATIEVDDREFRAGRARLPLEVVSGVETFRGQEAVLERGQRLDARAWVLFRGWVSPVIRVDLHDPEDPTPYWLISTRTPERLAAAISAGRAAES